MIPQQLQFPGMESEPPPRRRLNPQTPWSGLTSPDAQRVAQLGHQRASAPPVGMRGSIPQRIALSKRLEKKWAAHAVWDSHRERMEAQDMDYEDYDEEPEKHPITGLPTSGEIETHHPFRTREGLPWGDVGQSIGFEPGHLPPEVSYHGSASSARRRASTTQYVPLPGMRTPQPSVSAARLHDMYDNPETRSSPRFPFPELPHVFSEPGSKPGERIYTLIDGNHRAASHLLQGRLFTEAHVLTPEDIPTVEAHSERIQMARRLAARNPAVDKSMVAERMERNLYGF